MLLADIQRVLTLEVWQKYLKSPIGSYVFKDSLFFVQRIDSMKDYWLVTLRDGLKVMFIRTPYGCHSCWYEEFCEQLLTIWSNTKEGI